jgi:hypothetical protein
MSNQQQAGKTGNSILACGLGHGAVEETVGEAPAARVVSGVVVPGTAVVLVAAGAGLVAGAGAGVAEVALVEVDAGDEEFARLVLAGGVEAVAGAVAAGGAETAGGAAVAAAAAVVAGVAAAAAVAPGAAAVAGVVAAAGGVAPAAATPAAGVAETSAAVGGVVPGPGLGGGGVSASDFVGSANLRSTKYSCFAGSSSSPEPKKPSSDCFFVP